MPEIPTLEINVNVECTQCHEMGVTPSGSCLKCVADNLRDKTEYSLELVRIDFTPEEKIDLGLKVAKQVRELKSIEAQKKSAMADFTAREKQANLEMDELARKIDDGFEMRRENCRVQWDDPTHMVHFILEHDESNFIVKQRKMTPSEMQRSLPEF